MSYSEGMADMLAVVKRLTASGFSEAQAEAVIEAIGDVRDDLATRADLQAQSAEFRGEMAALELRLTIRLGAVVGATSLVTIGVIAALIALL